MCSLRTPARYHASLRGLSTWAGQTLRGPAPTPAQRNDAEGSNGPQQPTMDDEEMPGNGNPTVL
eukprot:6185024-Lingulodinium_polyedra.AAC.1